MAESEKLGLLSVVWWRSVKFGGDFLESGLVERRAGVRGESPKCDGPPSSERACGSSATLGFPEGFFVFFWRWDEELGLEQVMAEL